MTDLVPSGDTERIVADICFLDTETLGLHPDAPVWEFAAIRRFNAEGTEERFHCFIDHDPHPWVDQFSEPFKADYLKRFSGADIRTRWEAAAIVDEATSGAHIVGAVPDADTERLTKLLANADIAPSWHYHLIDIENVVVGWLAALTPLSPLMPPWDSEDLSKAVNVDPTKFARHTAMGDVLWVQAQWDAVMTASQQRRSAQKGRK